MKELLPEDKEQIKDLISNISSSILYSEDIARQFRVLRQEGERLLALTMEDSVDDGGVSGVSLHSEEDGGSGIPPHLSLPKFSLANVGKVEEQPESVKNKKLLGFVPIRSNSQSIASTDSRIGHISLLQQAFSQHQGVNSLSENKQISQETQLSQKQDQKTTIVARTQPLIFFVPSSASLLSPSNTGNKRSKTTKLSSNLPSNLPNNLRSNLSSNITRNLPSNLPSNLPNNLRSDLSSNIASNLPGNIASNLPSNVPSNLPNNIASNLPSNIPSNFSSNIPSNYTCSNITSPSCNTASRLNIPFDSNPIVTRSIPIITSNNILIEKIADNSKSDEHITFTNNITKDLHRHLQHSNRLDSQDSISAEPNNGVFDRSQSRLCGSPVRKTYGSVRNSPYNSMASKSHESPQRSSFYSNLPCNLRPQGSLFGHQHNNTARTVPSDFLRKVPSNNFQLSSLLKELSSKELSVLSKSLPVAIDGTNSVLDKIRLQSPLNIVTSEMLT